MKNKISILTFEIISTIFIMILGTLLHFTYDWSNKNPIISTFSAINESTWEHLKLLFFPMLITTIIGHYYYKESYPNYLCNKTQGILYSLSFIIVFFYTYTGIIGTNIPILDISSFFIAVLIGQIHSYKNINSKKKCNKIASIIILIILTISFILFTYVPPKINLFKDPTTGMFGILLLNFIIKK